MPKTKTRKKTQKAQRTKPAIATATKNASPTSPPTPATDRQTRRFVRIEVSSPVSFVPFRMPLAGPVDVSQVSNGRVLNISGGGLLLETSAWVEPSDYLL
ncbi:MAG: PilZ domain-containing protein, partial [candidate division Zixibacteria bacterium]|nr:PilZ domain-containing protein [candidate division Zixibacteria bacterium]